MGVGGGRGVWKNEDWEGGRFPTVLSHNFDSFAAFSFPWFNPSKFKMAEALRKLEYIIAHRIEGMTSE